MKAEAFTMKEKLKVHVITDKMGIKENESKANNTENISNNNNIFSISKNNPNSNDKLTIPYIAKLSDGLYFKVQIGAFKTPVASDAFRGLQPVAFEDGPNSWLRYTVGLFQTFESANLAKKEIRTIGYKDAFVVAYHNGKRISIYEAGLLIHDYSQPQQKTYQVVYNDESKVLK